MRRKIRLGEGEAALADEEIPVMEAAAAAGFRQATLRRIPVSVLRKLVTHGTILTWKAHAIRATEEPVRGAPVVKQVQEDPSLPEPE